LLLFEKDHGAMVMAALMGGMGAPHRPVLLKETMEVLAPERGGLFVDGTLGMGGHSEAILEASTSTRVIGIDRDPEALELARKRLERFGSRFSAVHGNFKDIDDLVSEHGGVSGILVDLGVSSLQFDSEQRGFSFRFDAPLDMRMDASSDELTAAELLETMPEDEIANLIYQYGEERRSRKIARWIVERRETGRAVRTTRELADLVARAVGYKKGNQIHPATRTFQALRIAVNRELEGLDSFVQTSVKLLEPGGRFAAISFHSLEDRIIKQGLRRLAGQCICPPRVPICSCGATTSIEILTRRPIVAGDEEVEQNPRARSAKLRASRKL
jgi:16S rRNA (cytosine1402-N4)-methyltransferase